MLEDLLLPNPQEVEYADPLAGTAMRRPIANVIHERALYPVQGGGRPANRMSGGSGARMLAALLLSVIQTRITQQYARISSSNRVVTTRLTCITVLHTPDVSEPKRADFNTKRYDSQCSERRYMIKYEQAFNRRALPEKNNIHQA